jgi:hypothetical protein
MPLPQIVTPTYELELPSNGKKIKYRPFLVKEEKILILALESGDQKEISRAVLDVITNCIITKGIKVKTLPIFDIEYLFLNIRAKSIGETIELDITCGDDGVTKVSHEVPIDDIKVVKSVDHNPVIQLTNELKLKMKYPEFDDFLEKNFDMGTNDSKYESTLKTICSCVECIYNEATEECWYASDYTEKELKEYIENQLTSKHYKQVKTFFDTIPKLKYEFTVTNPNTGVENPIVLEGLADFFA